MLNLAIRNGLLVLLMLVAYPAHSVLIVEDGEVVGFTNVLVPDGQPRTFDFVGGSFEEVFGGELYDFDTTLARLLLANDLSLDPDSSIPIPSPFRNNPSAIRGCSDTQDCAISFPRTILTQFGTPQLLSDSVLVQSVGEVLPNSGFLAGLDFSSPVITWAVLRPIAVPEPSSLGLLGIGLAGIVVARRRRKP